MGIWQAEVSDYFEADPLESARHWRLKTFLWVDSTRRIMYNALYMAIDEKWMLQGQVQIDPKTLAHSEVSVAHAAACLETDILRLIWPPARKNINFIKRKLSFSCLHDMAQIPLFLSKRI